MEGVGIGTRAVGRYRRLVGLVARVREEGSRTRRDIGDRTDARCDDALIARDINDDFGRRRVSPAAAARRVRAH